MCFVGLKTPQNIIETHYLRNNPINNEPPNERIISEPQPNPDIVQTPGLFGSTDSQSGHLK